MEFSFSYDKLEVTSMYTNLTKTTIQPNNSATTNDGMLNKQQMLVICVLNIVSASLSVLGSGSILICSSVRRKACMAEVFPIYQLSFADLLASSMMITGASLYLSDRINPLKFGYELDVCSIISALTKCFYINTFLLTLSYAIEALLRIRLRFQSNPTRRLRNSNYQVQYLIYVLSWVLPIAVTVVLVAMSSLDSHRTDMLVIVPGDCTMCLPIFHYSQNLCWANKTNGPKWLLAYRMLFVVPLIVVMLTNLILYLCIYYSYRRSNISRGLLAYHQRKEEASIRTKAVLYQSVFATCWIFSLILGLIVLIDPATKYGMADYYGLFVAQAITAPSQGFFNSLIYGWKRRGFKNAINQSTSSGPRYTTYQSISL